MESVRSQSLVSIGGLTDCDGTERRKGAQLSTGLDFSLPCTMRKATYS